MNGPGARFQPIAYNRKLATVEIQHLPPEQHKRYGRHVFDRRPIARAPFCCSTSVSIQATCPEACPFKRDENGEPGGCFADASFQRMRLKRMDEESIDMSAFEVVLEEAVLINDAFPRGVPQDGARGGRDLRLHVAGDVQTDGAAALLATAAARWKERGGGSVWTYTHSWREVARDSWGPISVLASVETATQAREARLRGYAPALVVEQFPDKKAFSVDGVKVVPCPAETTGTTCVDCRLCLDRPLHEMGVGIAFAAHGLDVDLAVTALRAAGRRVP